MPRSRCRARSSTRMRSCSRRSRSPKGSSSRIAFGRVTSTRARATRCCWPDESSRGLRCFIVPRPTISTASPAVFSRVRLVDAAHLEAEGDVLEHRAVREEREVLEDGGDGTLGRLDAVQHLAVEADRARARLVVAADHPQRRGLAAAGRAEQRHVLAVLDVQVGVLDRGDVAGEDAVDVLENEARAVAARRSVDLWGCGGCAHESGTFDWEGRRVEVIHHGVQRAAMRPPAAPCRAAASRSPAIRR